MGLFRKIRHGLIAIAMSPFCWLETKEREKRLEERMKRAEQKQKHLSSPNT